MILQEKIRKKAEGFGKLAPVFLEGARFALENQWISVEDELPPEEDDGLSIRVVVATTKNEAYFRRYDYNERKWLCPISGTEFTHWQLLPETPKE